MTVKILLILTFSIVALKSSSGFYMVDDSNSNYPPPRVVLKYMNNAFTEELVMSRPFRDNQFVPIQIELIKSEIEGEQAHDLYLTIESVEVIFAVQESVPLTRTNFKGHLIMMGLYWAPKFTLEVGSRIIFNIKYNYNLHDKVVETGETTEEIRFYGQKMEKLEGYVIGNTPKENITIYFNGQWLMTFKGEAYRIAFEINRLPLWGITGRIQEFEIERKTLFGIKRVPFEVAYEPDKKYLIISREWGRKKSEAFVGRWSDEVPERPPVKK